MEIESRFSQRHPVLRLLGHAFGIAYILFTLLFGPIKSLTSWLARRALIQRYKNFIANLPPAAGLAASFLSLGMLELSKLIVILAWRKGGIWAAGAAMIASKAILGYAAHTTWHAARPRVIATYAWARRADIWVGARLAALKAYRDWVLAALRDTRAWGQAVAMSKAVRERASIVLAYFRSLRAVL